MAEQLRRLYLTSTAVSGAAKVFLALSGVAMVWFLNIIFGKDLFGAFMVVFALYQIIAITLASTFQSLILFHTPDHDKTSTTAEISDLEKSCFSYSALISFLVCVAFIACAPWLAQLFGKPELQAIFITMAATIPAFTTNLVLTGWYRAHQDIVKLTIYNEIIPSIMRISAMGILAFMPSLHSHALMWASIVYAGSYALPAIALYVQKPILPHFSTAPFTLWDVRHALSSGMGQLLMRSSRNIIIVISGAIASNAVTADFAIATRFGQLLLVPKNAIAQLLMPRIRAHLKRKEHAALRTEFTAMQAIMLSATMVGTIFFLLFAPTILGWFGDYGYNAFLILILLSLSSIIISSFGDIGGYTSMAGYADWGLATHFTSLMVLIGSLFVFVPMFDGLGMAYAHILGSLVSCSMLCAIIAVKEKHVPIHWPEIFVFVSYAALLIGMVQYGLAQPFMIAGLAALICVIYIFIRIKIVLQLFGLTQAKTALLP